MTQENHLTKEDLNRIVFNTLLEFEVWKENPEINDIKQIEEEQIKNALKTISKFNKFQNERYAESI